MSCRKGMGLLHGLMDYIKLLTFFCPLSLTCEIGTIKIPTLSL